MSYGFGATTASTAPSTTGDLASGTATTFSWTTNQKKVLVQSLPDSGPTIYGKWNATGAAANSWDFCLSAGMSVSSPDGISVSSLSLCASDSSTWTDKTHFTVRGFR